MSFSVKFVFHLLSQLNFDRFCLDFSNGLKDGGETVITDGATTSIDDSHSCGQQHQAVIDRTEELEAQLLAVRTQLAQALNENSQLQHTLRKMQATVSSNSNQFQHPSHYE